jgi:hypothetical protein
MNVDSELSYMSWPRSIMIPQFDGFRRLRSVQLPDERYSTIDLMSD